MSVTFQCAPNYFPKLSRQEVSVSDGRVQTGQVVSVPDGKEQKEEYTALCKTVQSIQGLLDDTNGDYQRNKNALAFLIEAMKQSEPRDWKSRLEGTRQRIVGLSQQEHAAAEVSWFLYDLIKKLYISSIAQRINFSRDGLDILLPRQKRIIESSQVIKEAVYKEGQPVEFGMILPNDVPLWLN